MNAVAIVSGGMDSATLAYYLADQGYKLHLLAFDYGQRHRKELDYAHKIAHNLHAGFDVLDLSGIGHLLTGSALTDPTIPVPDGHYAAATMRATVVPNRNAIMLSIAVGVAVAEGAKVVAAGVHAGDHPIYPDCRPEFIGAFNHMARIATDTHALDDFAVIAPFVHHSKADIVTLGSKLGVPYADTWSCYKGGDLHCGTCGTCVERREAFLLAGIQDPTVYNTSPLGGGGDTSAEGR